MLHSDILIVGADGFLGSHLAARFSRSRNVFKTFLKSENESANSVSLDLQTDFSKWQIPDNIPVCFICAAVTSVEQCESDKEGTWQINVTRTLELVRRLSEQGAKIIFPSTSLVHDGSMPRVKADVEPNPPVEYGRQKAFVEKQLMNLNRSKHAVIRFSKILGPAISLIRSWIADLRVGKIIHPFSDMFFSPVSIDIAGLVMERILAKDACGIMQISGAEDVSYAEFATRLAEKLGCPGELVQPVKVADSGLVIRHLPRYTTLDSSIIERELGIKAPSVSDTVDSILLDR